MKIGNYRIIDHKNCGIGFVWDTVKPEYRDGDPDAPICPNCRTPLNEMEDCDCGQKIDWSEE